MNIRQLTKELQRKAEEELNEVPSRMEEDVQHIREWLKKQPHLRVRDDDQAIVGFLRGCKYRLQQTKEKIDLFYTVRSSLPDYFVNRDPFLPEIQTILDANIVTPLPYAENSTEPRILMFRCTTANYHTMSLVNLLKVYFMCLDILMNEDDGFMIAGVIALTDYDGFSLGYIKQVELGLVKDFITILIHTYPLRIKRVQYVNVPSIIKTLYNTMKPIISEKIKNRVFMYSGKESDNTKKVISPDILPNEYGGHAGSIDDLAAAWRKKFESYRQWFLEDESYRTDEKLRLGKSKYLEQLGTDGSFRKLEID